ncbi:MAG: hypothetical protein IMZ46_16215 [Acidobacteria bacterium]|nr:hypothetical protein [Acidobacteriota bacterium]
MNAGRRIAAFLVLLGLAAAARAQGLSVSLAAGSFRASEEVYREIYGAGTPFAVDVWLKFKGPFGLAVGYGWVGDTGLAVPMDGGDAEYPVEFRRTSIPVVVFYQLDFKAVDIRLGAGLCAHRYEEMWETVDLGFKGNKASPRFFAAVSVALLGRLSLFGSATYDTIPTGAGSPFVNEVDLGGVQILGGISFRIF